MHSNVYSDCIFLNNQTAFNMRSINFFFLRELGIGIVPFSPLGKGFFATGPKMVETFADNDFRKVCVSNGYVLFTFPMELQTS